MLISRQTFSPDDAPGSSTATATPPAAPAAGATPASPPAKPPEGKPPTPTAPAAPAKPEDTEGLKTLVGDFLDVARPKEPAKPKAGEKPKEPDKPATPAKPKAAAKPRAVPPPAPPLTPEQIAAAATEGATRALTAMKAEGDKPVTPAADTFKFTEKQQRTIGILEKMAELNPTKYEGIAQKYGSSIKKLSEYSAQWLAEHPGQEFDETAQEHETFFAANDIDWDDDDYVDALAEIRVDQRTKKIEEKTERKFSELERKERLVESAPVIAAHQIDAAREYWTKFGEEFAGVISPNGSVNQDVIAAMAKKDRVAFGIRLASAKDLQLEVAELYKVMNGLEPFMDKPPARNDPNYAANYTKYQVHQALSEFAADQEAQLMRLPAHERLNEHGHAFLPAAQYWKLPKDQREGKWTFSAKDIALLRAKVLAEESQERIKKQEETYRAWAEDHGLALPAKPPEPAKGEKVEPGAETEDDDGKPLSPAAGGESKLAATQGRISEDEKNPLGAFAARGIY